MPNKRFALIATLSLTLPLVAAGQDSSLLGPPPAQDPVTAAPEADLPPTEAELTIDKAIQSVRERQTIAADIAMDADMLGQSFQVAGQYLKAEGNRMLLRLSVEGLGESTGTMQQVSDGVTFKDYRRILDQQVMSTFQMDPVLKALDNPDADELFRQQVTAQLGLAGPETLLTGLRRVAHFDQLTEETLNDRAVWVIRGVWKDRDALALPGSQMAMMQSGFLPSYVPSHITLWIDKESGWPWKVKLEGRVPSVLREERMLGPDGRPVGRKSAQGKERPSRMELSYTLTDRKVEPSEFVFEAPPNVAVQDITESITAGLQGAFAQLAARKRSEDAQRGGLLDQALPAPRPVEGSSLAPAPAPAEIPEQFRSSVPIR